MSQYFINNNPVQSVFEKNYGQISESKKEILNQKYNCGICLEIIKHENPFLCYQCQKIFHHSCLQFWDSKQKQMNRRLSCPNCRNELPIEQWKELRNYDEMRTKDALIYNQLGKSLNPNDYMYKSMNLFKFILNKLNAIHPKITPQKNYNLNNLIEVLKYNITNPSIDEISKVIAEELNIIEKYFTNGNNKVTKKEETKYKNEINIKYMTQNEGNQRIFGGFFVENNINNIILIINGKKSPLVSQYYLRKGENNVTICIKNPLTDLSNMFPFCETLYNIDELRYLNTKNVTNFSAMFEYTKISNVQALENWDTSKSENFSDMFYSCELLTSIKPLQNWNVSKCKDLSNIFNNCIKITDLTPIQNWNIANCKNLNHAFASCKNISDIKPLKNWNVSNVKDLSGLFYDLENLLDITSIQNWNVSNCENFSELFADCKKIYDLSPLKNWKVSNAKNLRSLFSHLKYLSDLTPIQNWDISKCENISYLFSECENLINIAPIKNWNVSNVRDAGNLFNKCKKLSDISPIRNWNVSKIKDFSFMFYECSLLKDINH